MIYLEPSSLGWRPFFKSWLNVFPEILAKEALDVVEAMFEWLVDPCFVQTSRQEKDGTWSELT
jgi:dynein heavy chain